MRTTLSWRNAWKEHGDESKLRNRAANLPLVGVLRLLSYSGLEGVEPEAQHQAPVALLLTPDLFASFSIGG